MPGSVLRGLRKSLRIQGVVPRKKRYALQHSDLMLVKIFLPKANPCRAALSTGLGSVQ
jgi:hypothetical protein